MFKETHPILGTRDIQRAIGFYTGQLGFRLAFGETRQIRRTTLDFAATPSSSTCSFNSSMRWAQSG
jgi:catechol 2,3-dioxygenase-like lactoylglutathione lyase family enzyme